MAKRKKAGSKGRDSSAGLRAVGGTVAGAAAGSLFGPVGAAVGAVVGGVAGLRSKRLSGRKSSSPKPTAEKMPVVKKAAKRVKSNKTSKRAK
jgi:phage tail tape-measure protein